MRGGRDAAVPCIERFHDQGQTYAECVRHVAAQRGAPGLRRLGALTQGWFTADLVAQQTADGDAPAAARALLTDADALQRQLGVPDAALCTVLEQDCATLRRRRHAVRAAAAG